MRRAATILVLGDPGPVRDELMLRPEIDVIWAESFDDAGELLRVYGVDACIVSPAFEELAGYEAFRTSLGTVPILVCRPDTKDLLSAPWSEEVEEALTFLAHHTGLVFARYPRASLELPVMVETEGRSVEAETFNLSVSGMGVRGFPDVAPGTRVELCLELPRQPLYLLARVVRVQVVDGVRHAGLSFTDLQEMPRLALARCVEEATPPLHFDGRLFGELEVPMPRRIEETSDQPTEGERRLSPGHPDPFVEPAMRALTPRSETGNLPPWFQHLTEDLSEVERLAAVGGDAPEWAHRVLRLRISLARARAEQPGDMPPALVDEAYRTFAGLEQETMDAPVEMQRQVSSIRASLLRDVLGKVA